MASMKEIAELAGVSRGTVDRVINNRNGVHPATKQRILDIIETLGYEPNKAGIALAAQKRKIKIGVVLFGMINPFFDQIIDGLNKKLDDLSIYGCSLLIKRIPFDIQAQLDAVNELVAEDINGLILSPYNDVRIQKEIDMLWEQNIPSITINTDIPDSKRIAYVGSDFYRGGETAAGLLALFSNGHAKVGVITGSHNILSHEQRIQGFWDNLAESYPGICIAEIVENKDDDEKSYSAVTHLIEKYPDMNALYFTAAGVQGGCLALKDTKTLGVKVVSFDTVPSTVEMVKKGIISATICQQPEEQGSKALAILVDYLVNGTMPENDSYLTDLSIKIKENI